MRSRRPLGPFSTSETGGPSSLNARDTYISGTHFLLDRRYDITGPVGSGAYGVVVSATDTVTHELVAIKKIENTFDHPTYTKRTLRELKILRLMEHENIIGIKSIQLPRSQEEMKEIYVINELMETDLTDIIRSDQELDDGHCQFFVYQILRGLKYLHSADILHRDLKPRNLLVNSSCDLKICDFGLSRANLPGVKVRGAKMTDYVATRWYRAPEILLSYHTYTKALDVWSVGCILGELLIRKPILPGNDPVHQLDLIFSLIGKPSASDIAAIPTLHSRKKLLNFPRTYHPTIDTVFSHCNPLAVSLLKQMLVFDPNKRITVEDALTHPYLSYFHDINDEATTTPVSPFDFTFEREKLTMEELKDMVYEEILLYHFPRIRQEYEYNKQMFEVPPNSMALEEEQSGESDE